MSKIKLSLYNNDMFKAMKKIKSGTINAVITDFPYGTLNAKRNLWDRVIDYEKFWQEVKRIGKDNCVVISTAQQPFTSYLINTNLIDFKYTIVWEKSKATGYLNAKKQPLRAHEDIVVFYNKQCTYNPQMTIGVPYDKGTAVRDTEHYGEQKKSTHVKSDGARYPRTVQYFKTAEFEGKLHPTQKPIELYEWLVRTYTNEGDIVLDPCMGSGTTGLACINLKRNFVGIEMEEKYFITAKNRLNSKNKSDLKNSI